MFNAFADDAKQFARELAAEGGLWLLMGLLILVSLGFIIAATYLALASSMGPIAACAILAGVLLIAAGATAIILSEFVERLRTVRAARNIRSGNEIR